MQVIQLSLGLSHVVFEFEDLSLELVDVPIVTGYRVLKVRDVVLADFCLALHLV
jgi:hypothetical protein